MRKFPRTTKTVYLISKSPAPLPFDFPILCPPYLILFLNTDHLDTHNWVLFHYFTMLGAAWLPLQRTSVARSAPSSKTLAFCLKLATVSYSPSQPYSQKSQNSMHIGLLRSVQIYIYANFDLELTFSVVKPCQCLKIQCNVSLRNLSLTESLIHFKTMLYFILP